MLHKENGTILTFEINIEIDPTQIKSFTVESFLLNLLINQYIKIKNYHLTNNFTQNTIRLARTDIPEKLSDDPLFKNNSNQFEIHITLKYEIVIRPRANPLPNDTYRYEILSKAKVDYFLCFDANSFNHMDKNNLKPNGVVFVFSSPLQSEIFYINQDKDFFPFATERRLIKPKDCSNLTLEENEQFDKFLASTFIPNLGASYKTRVSKTIGTLAPDKKNPCFLICKNKARAIKKRSLENSADKLFIEQRLEKEKNIGNSLGFHYKTSVYQDNELAFYTTMELLNGKTAFQFLAEGPDTDECLTLCLELTWALKKLHDLSYIHGDLKPENVLVNLSAKPALRIFDFDLSIKNGQPSKSSGTMYYNSPEILLKKGNSFATDIFSLGIIFTEIWDCKYFRSLTNESEINKRKFSSFQINFIEKDFAQTDLNDFHKNKIKEVIWNLTKYKAEDRCTLIQAIKIIEGIIQDRFISNIKDILFQNNIIKAYSLAVSTREQLDSLDTLVSQDIPLEDQISEVLSKAIINLPDNEIAIKYFIDNVRIAAIANCKSISEIKNEISNIIELLKNTFRELSSRMNKIQEYKKAINTSSKIYQQYHSLEEYFNAILKIVDMNINTIDNYKFFNSIFNKIFKNLDIRLAQIETEISAQQLSSMGIFTKSVSNDPKEEETPTNSHNVPRMSKGSDSSSNQP